MVLFAGQTLEMNNGVPSVHLKAPVNVYFVNSPLTPEFHSPPPPFPEFFRDFVLKGAATHQDHFLWQTLSPEVLFAQLGSVAAGSVVIMMDFVLQEGGWAGEPQIV